MFGHKRILSARLTVLKWNPKTSPLGGAFGCGTMIVMIPVLGLSVEFTTATLAVFLALVSIFYAAVSVVLMYHWRRFPFEEEIFDRVEHWYFSVSLTLLGISILAMLVS